VNRLEVLPVATVLVVLYAVVGGVLVILSAAGHVDPKLALSFDAYLKSMALAVAGLAVGRGVAAKGRR
jgi:hypothetical protein